MNRKNFIYIDITDTYLNGLNTGVQRVVRNIVKRTDIIEKITGMNVVPVMVKNGKLIKAAGANFENPSKFSNLFNKLSLKLKNIYLKLEGKINLYLNKIENPNRNRNENKFNYNINIYGHLRRFFKKIFIYFNLISLKRAADKEGEALPEEGDVLFFPDVFWTSFYDINKIIKKYKARNVKIIALIYDIIPIMHKEYCDAAFASDFRLKLDEMLKSVDCVITISKSEKNNIEAYIKGSGAPVLPVDYFYLGFDYRNDKGDDNKIGGEGVRSVFKKLSNKDNIFIMVGTIVPVKNHIFVINAFEKLWRDGSNAVLVIIGKADKSSAGVLSKIKSSGFLNKNLFFADDATDNELDYMYGIAKTLIIASVAEGFGLPLIEGLSKNLKIIASDIPVFREIARAANAAIYYFEAGDENSLISAVKNAAVAKFEKGSGWITWDKSVEMLSEKIKKLLLPPVNKNGNGVKINRILIDCSDTYLESLNTGIQRTVRNIMERSGIISGKFNVPVIPIVLDAKKGYVDLNKIKNKDGRKNKRESGNKLRSAALKIKERVKIISKEKLKIKETDNIYKFLKIAWYLIKKIKYFNAGLIQIYNSAVNKNRNRNININGIKNDAVFPGENDLLILADAFWDYRYNVYFDNFCKEVKKGGGIIIPVIYDIIPLTDPAFFEIDLVARFKSKLHRFKGLIDAIVTISKSEKKIIEEYLKKMFNIENKPVSYFYLGCDIKCDIKLKANKKISGENIISNGVRENLTETVRKLKSLNASSYLMVGTIEPRKGYDYVIEAFESMWKTGYGGALIIVGKIGWKVDEPVKKINRSAYLNKKLFLFNDLSDDELCFLYNGADAFIFASLREGYGLPLVEAMNHRLPVIASDIPVFREISGGEGERGGNYPFIYFTPDKNGLINAVKEFENKPHENAQSISAANRLISWDESINAFSDVIFELLIEIRDIKTF